MSTVRMTNGTECFTCTVTATDEQGPAEAMDSNGARYYRDDYSSGWTSDAAEECVTLIREGESDEDAKARLMAELEPSDAPFEQEQSCLSTWERGCRCGQCTANQEE
jgi:hypothetical protein